MAILFHFPLILNKYLLNMIFIAVFYLQGGPKNVRYKNGILSTNDFFSGTPGIYNLLKYFFYSGRATVPSDKELRLEMDLATGCILVDLPATASELCLEEMSSPRTALTLLEETPTWTGTSWRRRQGIFLRSI